MYAVHTFSERKRRFLPLKMKRQQLGANLDSSFELRRGGKRQVDVAFMDQHHMMNSQEPSLGQPRRFLGQPLDQKQQVVFQAPPMGMVEGDVGQG